MAMHAILDSKSCIREASAALEGVVQRNQSVIQEALDAVHAFHHCAARMVRAVPPKLT